MATASHNNDLRLTSGDLRRRLVVHPSQPPLPPAAPAEEALPGLATSAQQFARITPLPRPRAGDADFRRALGEQSEIAALFIDPPAAAAHREEAAPEIDTGLAAFQAENLQLRQLLEETRALLGETDQIQNETQERDGQYREEIATLRQQVEALREQLASVEDQVASGDGPSRSSQGQDEMAEWADELEREQSRLMQERRALDADRQQLREDEKALEKQMCQMEVQMARERAMIARQENELRRLNSEIQHEIEAFHRGDGTLRDQLAGFQRRHQEVFERGISNHVAQTQEGNQQRAGAPSQAPATSSPTESAAPSRRLFRPKG